MHEASAILAINSLDRYITNVSTIFNELLCSWVYPGAPTTITYTQAPGYSFTPVVGATLISNGAGWPAGNVSIIAVSANTPTFTISAPVTASALRQDVFQQYQISNANQPTSNSLISQYYDSTPYSNNFTIQSPGALIYGYINRIVVSQVQLQYNIPTICLGKNDIFFIAFASGFGKVKIPNGFYYADELAATLQILINDIPALAALNITVVFNVRNGFIFTSGNNTPFYFPNPQQLTVVGASTLDIENILKCYRLLGITIKNEELLVTQTSFDYPNFLYTPYIDIYSDVLTNYQDVKDTNTSVSKLKGMVARIYLSGTGQNQVVVPTSALGTNSFVMTADLNSPKVIKWTPDVAVPSIDFQLYDQYGDLIPGAKEGYSTEFQMTLLCLEAS